MSTRQVTGQEAGKILRDLSHGSKGVVVVLGAGISGREVAALFLKAGLRVIVLDEKRLSDEVREYFVQKAIICCSSEYRATCFQSELDNSLKNSSLENKVQIIDEWVASPEQIAELVQWNPVLGVFSSGILPKGKFIESLGSTHIPVVSEMDLALHYLASSDPLRTDGSDFSSPDIAVTGTNGKTTTVTLAHFILQNAHLSTRQSNKETSLAQNRECLLLGNVGTPFSGAVRPENLMDDRRLDVAPMLVAELSSYQLDSSLDIHPHIAVCLNITADHLEKHKTMENYIEAKSRIFAKQTSNDWAIYYADDPFCVQSVSNTKARRIPLSFTPLSPPITSNSCVAPINSSSLNCSSLSSSDYCWLHDREFTLFLGGEQYDFSLGSLEGIGSALWGKHNLINAAAASVASFLCGVSAAEISIALAKFSPLPHRLETVKKHRDVLWINDSKSTNVASVQAALEAVAEQYPERRMILLVGGIAKGGPWHELKHFLGKKVRAVLLFGRDRWSIAPQLVYEQVPQVGFASPHPDFLWEAYVTLKEAVVRADVIASDSDIVLLSPGCASFDEFLNFEDRGLKYREYIDEIFQIS